MTRVLRFLGTMAGKVTLAGVVLALLGASAWGGYSVGAARDTVDGIAAATIHAFDIDGDAALVIEPETPNGSAVLVVHGSGADETITLLPYMEDFTAELLDAGWTVASANGAGEAWGSFESQDAYAALGSRIESRYGVERTVVVSVSMGGIAGLNLTASGAIATQVGWFGVNTVTNLTAVYEGGDSTESIDAVMGAEEREAIDPLRLVETDFAVPLVVYTGDQDRVVPGSVHAVPFAERTGAMVVECTGGHVEIGCFSASDLLDLFG